MATFYFQMVILIHFSEHCLQEPWTQILGHALRWTSTRWLETAPGRVLRWGRLGTRENEGKVFYLLSSTMDLGEFLAWLIQFSPVVIRNCRQSSTSKMKRELAKVQLELLLLHPWGCSWKLYKFLFPNYCLLIQHNGKLEQLFR